MNEKAKSFVSLKSYVSGLIVILLLMIATYVLTFVIPSGEFPRIDDGNGNMILDTSQEFSYVASNFPFYKFILSPFLVLSADGSTTIIAVIAFIIIVGGVMNSLNRCGLMDYMVKKIVSKYGDKRYLLLAILTFFFMALGAFVGSFEEVVPLVPLLVTLAISLGFDAFVGIGVSLVAVGCGFATGVINPFTIGVAQQLANVPIFSGIWLRLLSFVLIYLLLVSFILIYAKRIAKNANDFDISFENNKDLNRALIIFASILLTGMLIIISSTFLTFLQDYTMIIFVVMFLIAGVSGALASKANKKEILKAFGFGVLSMLPAILMILMASSIKYILVEAKILDTILYYCVNVANTLPRWTIILFIYFIALVVNFFVSSGSAEAVLLIPLLVPIAAVFDIPAQLVVLAYAFGDGFSNVFYPTNPALLISLSVSDVSYKSYAKWAYKFQLANLLLTALILLFGLAVNYH